MRFDRPTILTCAVTGSITTREQHAGLPVTPAEIATACIEAAQAGAAIVHVHVRDPATTKPSMELALYRDVVERIRRSGVDVLINLTTGVGGRFMPGDPDLKVFGPGTTLTTPERRVEHVVALRPELASLDLNTMWSGAGVVINTPKSCATMAEALRGAGTKPELEVFDTGDIHLANDLIAKGHIDAPALFQLVLGVRWGATHTSETMAYMVSLLPKGSHWAAFGIGRMEYPMLAQALVLGGHIRVGMEDNVYLGKGMKTPGIAALVERAKRIVEDLGGVLATPAEARAMLGLRGA